MTDQEDYEVITPGEEPKRSSIWWIILIVFLVVVCCCCAGVLIFYYYIGDWVLGIFRDISFQLGTSFY